MEIIAALVIAWVVATLAVFVRDCWRWVRGIEKP